MAADTSGDAEYARKLQEQYDVAEAVPVYEPQVVQAVPVVERPRQQAAGGFYGQPTTGTPTYYTLSDGRTVMLVEPAAGRNNDDMYRREDQWRREQEIRRQQRSDDTCCLMMSGLFACCLLGALN